MLAFHSAIPSPGKYSVKAVFISQDSFDFTVWSLKAFGADAILVIFVGRDEHVGL
jgi:hypothetical protein